MILNQKRDRTVRNYVERDVLMPGERIRWSGQPSPVRAMRLAFRGVAISLAFAVIALFWARSESANLFFMIAIALFFIVPAAWSLTKPIKLYWRARRTFYFITDKRVLTVKAGRRMELISLAAGDIGRYVHTDRGDGTGDVFLDHSARDETRSETGTAAKFRDGLWGVKDCNAAVAAIAKLKSG